MATFIRVASTEEIGEGKGKTYDIDGRAIALFNVHGKYYAIENTCRHRGGPLGEGMLDDNVVTCPWHGWQYDVMSGKCLFNPSVLLKSFLVEVEGSDVRVAIE